MYLTPTLFLLLGPGLAHAAAVAVAPGPKVKARDLTVTPAVVGETITTGLDHLDLSEEGFIPPEGPDGLFTLSIDEASGTFTVKTIQLFDSVSNSDDGSLNTTATPDVGPPSAAGALAKRSLPISSWGCEGRVLASGMGGYTMAAAQFGQLCQSYLIPPSGAMWAKSGDNIAYGCSAGGLNPCSAAEFEWFQGFMISHCIRDFIGWAWMPSWKKTYGRSRRGDSICTTICNCVPTKTKRALEGHLEVTKAK
ncbi:hypothetical protein QBC34DRAFT_470466 [Podospora aff. communis PSN243]|uniref:Uncharacterized protein n=1 Tax=Podospora aff. communis PSN243 TaxID=3040156 RepID=A0AAV9GFQ7_9PEZI|nr:hypothetical protein QBC34DRAFT_470466 [Podospora aff. communis PSN243]